MPHPCSGGDALGHQVSIAAVQDAFAAEPLHGREGMLRDILCVVVAENIGILAHADIQLFVLGVPLPPTVALLLSMKRLPTYAESRHAPMLAIMKRIKLRARPLVKNSDRISGMARQIFSM